MPPKRKAPDSQPDAIPHPKQAKSNPAPVIKEVDVPVDDAFIQSGHSARARVFIDDDGTVYDVSMNQSNAGKNNNKFYRLQLLHDGPKYFLHTHWGRVGDRGQTKITVHNDLSQALPDFGKKFKDKSGLKFEDRHEEPKKGKYTYLEMSYADGEEGKKAEADGNSGGPAAAADEEPFEEPATSKLPVPTQELIRLIFDEKYFEVALGSIGYNREKLPLGQLSKATLKKGFECLQNLAALLKDATLAESKYKVSLAEAIEDLTNRYYSTIPHVFGRNKPPLVDNYGILKQEIDMLDTLSDMSIANDIIKTKAEIARDAERLSLLDQRFNQLNMQEMEPLDHSTSEFTVLKDYLINTSGHTHALKYELIDVFRLTRSGEPERFEQSEYSKIPNSRRRLLWHGSRTTNYGGILSQGLRIAPPEAPVSGYNFGKGVYLADISTKSANYCMHFQSGGTGLLLLCEAELGDSPFKLDAGDYNAAEMAINAGCISTKGVGRTAPQGWVDAGMVHESLKGVLMPDITKKPLSSKTGGILEYNEYIVYNIAQVRLRYLLRVQIT